MCWFPMSDGKFVAVEASEERLLTTMHFNIILRKRLSMGRSFVGSAGDARAAVSSIRRNGAIDELRGLAVLASFVRMSGWSMASIARWLSAWLRRRSAWRRFVLRVVGLCDLAKRRGDAGEGRRRRCGGALAFWLRRYSRVALPAGDLGGDRVLRLCGGRDRVGRRSRRGAGFMRIFIGGLLAGKAPVRRANGVAFLESGLGGQFYALARCWRRSGDVKFFAFAHCASRSAGHAACGWKFSVVVRPDGFLIGMAWRGMGRHRRCRARVGPAVYWLSSLRSSFASPNWLFGFRLARRDRFRVILAARLKQGAALDGGADCVRWGSVFFLLLVHLRL